MCKNLAVKFGNSQQSDSTDYIISTLTGLEIIMLQYNATMLHNLHNVQQFTNAHSKANKIHVPGTETTTGRWNQRKQRDPVKPLSSMFLKSGKILKSGKKSDARYLKGDYTLLEDGTFRA